MLSVLLSASPTALPANTPSPNVETFFESVESFPLMENRLKFLEEKYSGYNLYVIGPHLNEQNQIVIRILRHDHQEIDRFVILEGPK